MMDTTRIHSCNSFVRMMYAYSTPEIVRHEGWLKVVAHDRQGTPLDFSYSLLLFS